MVTVSCDCYLCRGHCLLESMLLLYWNVCEKETRNERTNQHTKNTQNKQLFRVYSKVLGHSRILSLKLMSHRTDGIQPEPSELVRRFRVTPPVRSSWVGSGISWTDLKCSALVGHVDGSSWSVWQPSRSDATRFISLGPSVPSSKPHVLMDT